MNATRKANSLPFVAVAFALTACGAQSDANADTGTKGTKAATVATTTAAAPQPAATPSSALPPPAIAAWETYARQQCRTIGERFAPVRFSPLAKGATVDRSGRGGFVATNFNGDGQPDFVAVTNSQGCSGAGPGPGAVDFIVSTASGYRAVEGFSGPFDAGMIKRRSDRDVVEFPGGFFGTCGDVAVAVWGWTGQRMEVMERRNSKGQSVDKEGCAVAARPSSSAGNSTFPPIEPGYWAGGVSCAEAIEEAAELPPDQASLYYLDARGGWIGRFEIQRYASIGGNRYRMTGRDHNENGSSPGQMDITVNNRTSFTDPRYGGRYTHCPTSTIPRAIRADFENR